MLLFIVTHLSWLAPHVGRAPFGWFVYWDQVPHVAAGFGTEHGRWYRFFEVQ